MRYIGRILWEDENIEVSEKRNFANSCVLYLKKIFFIVTLRARCSMVYLTFNKRGSTGVNGAAVSTDSELLSRFIISGLFVHVSCFVGLPLRRPPLTFLN